MSTGTLTRIGSSRLKTIAYFPRPLATVAPRDLLLMDALEPRPDDTALEIGTGSGSSLMRLAGEVATLHGLDIAAKPIERIRRALAASREPTRSVKLFVLDFCNPDAAGRLPQQYDLIFSCDTLEHVPDPGTFFANVYQALKPGGRLFLTFPNEEPSRAHGITFFKRRETLEGLLLAAGFTPDRICLETLRMTRAAARILQVGWNWPRTLVKRATGLVTGPRRGQAAPQTFDETDFFNAADRFEPLAPLINAYCWGVMRAMSLARPVYKVSPAPDVLWDTNILIRASR